MACYHGFQATRHVLSHVVDQSRAAQVRDFLRSALSGRKSTRKFKR